MHEGPFLFEALGIAERWVPLAGSLIVFLLVLLMGLAIRRDHRRRDAAIPSPRPTLPAVLEYLVETLVSFLGSILGQYTHEFARLLTGIFFFILCANLIGLIPGLLAPTTSLSINLAMALVVFIYYHYIGIRDHGVSYIKLFIGPVWWIAFLILPIEIISHFARILSLTLRLTGNMSGEHLVMGVFSHLLPIGLPVAFLFLGLFTAILQAFVFMTLSAIYIFLSIEIDH
ncbi:MAG TPA: F0F1 ATP synthase subunit A [bacterium]|nr:F0F1 ATP synthase subunit A [bacterium]